jgi:hypothetical protein
MKEEMFVDKVEKYFDYLKSEYNSNEIFAANSTVRPQTDGVVRYASKTTLIVIDSEAGQAAVKFIRIQDEERYYLDPVSIHEFLTTSELEKQILLSHDTKNKDAANAIFSKRFLLLSPEWKNKREDANSYLENQLKNYASWLKKNAELCLLGNFSKWPEFYEYKINRLIADELRRGGKETVMSVIKDEKGNFKTIKRPIFQNEKDHLVRLKKEILGV